MNSSEIRHLYDELREQGYAQIKLDKIFATRLAGIVKEFYALTVPKRLELCASQRLGFLGYIPSESEAHKAIELGIGNFPVFRDARQRGYSSFDFVVNSRVFSPLGIDIGNIWPSDTRFCREACALYRETRNIMLDISTKMVCELERRGIHCFLETKAFRPDSCSIMRLLEYPPLAEPAKSKEHTDYEFLSFIFSGREGLEVRDRNGAWQAISDVNDTAVLLPGDMFQLATNGIVKSTMHRVRFGRVQRRVVVYFQGLRYDQKLPTDRGFIANCFGHHLCGMLIRSTPHLAEIFMNGSLDVGFEVPAKNPLRTIV